MLARKAVEDVQIWLDDNTQYSVRVDGPSGMNYKREQRWLKPQPGFFKCNINASWINKSSLGGGAWITRVHHGQAT